MAKFVVEPQCGHSLAVEAISAVNEGAGITSPRLDASEYQCAICCELLLDPVVGAHKVALQRQELYMLRSRIFVGVECMHVNQQWDMPRRELWA
jgi:hypothetical protein